MANLQSDSQGFLSGGTPLSEGDDAGDLLRSIDDGVERANDTLEDLLRAIRGGQKLAAEGARRAVAKPAARGAPVRAAAVAEIDPLTGVHFSPARRAAAPSALRDSAPLQQAGGRAVAPRARDSLGRFVSAAEVRPAASSAAVRNAAASPAVKATAAAVSEAVQSMARAEQAGTPRARDALGRFGSGGSGGAGGAEKVVGALGSAASTLGQAASGLLQAGSQANIDPALAAVKELSDVVSPAMRAVSGPIARVLGGLGKVGRAVWGRVFSGFGASGPRGQGVDGGGDSLRVRVERSRIWGGFFRGVRQQHADSLAEQTRLKAIEAKAGESARHSSGARAVLGLVLTAVMSLGGIITRALSKLVSGLQGVLGGVLPRLLGSLGPAALRSLGRGGAAGPVVAGGAAKPTMKARIGRIARRVPVAGGLIAALAGAVGLADAALVGDDPSKSPDQNRVERGSRIGSVTGGTVGAIAGGAALAFLGPLGMALGSVAGGYIGEKLGGTIGEFLAKPEIWSKVTAAADSLSSAASSIWNSAPVKMARELAGDAAAAVSSGASYVANKVRRSFDGSVSAEFESGKALDMAISSGKGDKGGASYGRYQLNSGSLRGFLDRSGYAKQFAGMEPGTKAFDDRWRELAGSKDASAFLAAQRGYIEAENLSPTIDALKRGGVDLSGRGDAIREMLLSTSVQFGGTGAPSLIAAALKGRQVGGMSDAEIIDAVQGRKIAENENLFKSSSPAVRAGTLKRARAERLRLLDMAQNGPPPTASMIPLTGQMQAGMSAPVLQATATAGRPEAPAEVAPPTKAVPAASPIRADPGEAMRSILGMASSPLGAAEFADRLKSSGVGQIVVPALPPPPAALRVPDHAEVPIPSMSAGASQPAPPLEVTVRQPLGQGVSDRHIAHVVQGGIGGQ